MPPLHLSVAAGQAGLMMIAAFAKTSRVAMAAVHAAQQLGPPTSSCHEHNITFRRLTLADIYAGHVQVEGEGRLRTVQACVYNSTSEAKSGLGMRVRALDRKFDHARPVAPPPLVITESLYTVYRRKTA